MRRGFSLALILALFFSLVHPMKGFAQLLGQTSPPLDPADPVEKHKTENLKLVFNDRRVVAGFFLYLNFFTDLNLVALQNEQARLYKPSIAKRILFYCMDNLAEVNETVLQDYFDRGLSRIDSSKFAQAMTDFDKALIYDPENADAYLNRGVLFIYSAQYPEALKELDKAEKFDKKNAGVFFNRGLVEFTLGQYKPALAQLDTCIALDAQYARAYFERGLTLDALGEPQEAIKSLRRARGLNDPDAGEMIRKIKARKK